MVIWKSFWRHGWWYFDFVGCFSSSSGFLNLPSPSLTTNSIVFVLCMYTSCLSAVSDYYEDTTFKGILSTGWGLGAAWCFPSVICDKNQNICYMFVCILHSFSGTLSEVQDWPVWGPMTIICIILIFSLCHANLLSNSPKITHRAKITT